MQRIKLENFLNRSFKIVRIYSIIFLLGALIFSSSCSTPYKSHKKYKPVPCPCEQNRRGPHTYY
jgi:hypothetical protein